MIRHISWIILFFACVSIARAARRVNVAMNMDSAKAVLEVLRNPALSHEDSLRIAAPCNRQRLAGAASTRPVLIERYGWTTASSFHLSNA
jgi:hypothetical protein